MGIESSPALVNADQAYRLPRLALLGPFDHVITYIPSLDLYLDATTRFAPLGTLPWTVMDKPVLLTATGTQGRTPRSRPSDDFTDTRITMRVAGDGAVNGVSRVRMRGWPEGDSRSAQFDNIGRNPEDVARAYLARFGESGTGRIEVADPLALDQPWEVKTRFSLDPVVNVPGPSAMVIPVGIAPGQIRQLAQGGASSPRRFEFSCIAGRHREAIELRLPDNVRITRIPRSVSYANGPIRYRATYRRQGNLVAITRELVDDGQSHVCDARDDVRWADFMRVLQRDLRAQVFLR